MLLSLHHKHNYTVTSIRPSCTYIGTAFRLQYIPFGNMDPCFFFFMDYGCQAPESEVHVYRNVTAVVLKTIINMSTVIVVVIVTVIRYCHYCYYSYDYYWDPSYSWYDCCCYAFSSLCSIIPHRHQSSKCSY